MKKDEIEFEVIEIAGIYKAKTQRNDKCPCGSGKKYKKCCLPKILKK